MPRGGSCVQRFFLMIGWREDGEPRQVACTRNGGAVCLVGLSD